MGFSLSAMTRALPFAHLARVGTRTRADEDSPLVDDDERDRPAERDREDGARNDARTPRAQDDEPRNGDDAQDDHNEEDEEEDNDEGDGDDVQLGDGDSREDSGDDANNADERDSRRGKARRGRAQDDDDSEMHGSSVEARARRREQARCAAIFSSHAAARNPVLAANLAFRTRLARGAALAVLESTPAAPPANSGRVERNPRVGPGGTPGMNSRQAIASAWDHAFAKVNARKR
ncbi:hypothetical protein HDG34_005654 [Paraburkholderia sp. HC6.4b]|uniref:hypothetical protein n=1 Tax=unclassified Paraburkholderia TaxID=2615204 RepID=UPI0016211E41|nr:MULTISPECIES: hypothetical protein [unclassified Paraburkholderia]MBB5411693.1 hypothetical protein [Paraburkholderia sp. HC6.4b]MBB5453278.1 hypothetical protein [Paraburkholderia sp. Kb1A]